MITVSYWDLIILMGATLGFLLGLILIFKKNLRSSANNYLAILLFVLTIVNFESFSYQQNLGYKFLFLKYFSFEILCLIPLCIYFFIKNLLYPDFKITRFGFLLVLYCFIDLFQRLIWLSIYLYSGRLSPLQEKTYFLFSDVFQIISALLTLIVIFQSINDIKLFKQSLYNNYTEIEGRDLDWLKNTMIMTIFIIAMWIILSVSDFSNDLYQSSQNHMQLAYIMWICVSFAIFWAGYSMITHHSLIQDTNNYIKKVESITKNQQIIETSEKTTELPEKAKEHFQKIMKIVEDEEIYRDKNLTLASLSEKTGLSYSYVSQIINKNVNQNFFEFINTYRIKDVKKKMSDDEFDHYSIMGLAESSGFNSKSTFNSVFKKQTGVTPSAYRKQFVRTRS